MKPLYLLMPIVALSTLPIAVLAQVKVYTPSHIAIAVNEQAWRVQIETLQNMPIGRYDNLPPLIKDRLYATSINSGEVVVFAGDYYSPKDAEDALRILKNKQYYDAFIVRFNLQDKLSDPPTEKLMPSDLNTLKQQSNPLKDYAMAQQGNELPPKNNTPEVYIEQVADKQIVPTINTAKANEEIAIAEPEPSPKTNSTEIIAPNPTNKADIADHNAADIAIPTPKDDIVKLYFVQLGLFEYAKNKTYYQKLADIGNVLTTLIEWNNKTVNQIVVGPFESEIDAQKAQANIKNRQFDGHIIALPYYQKQIDAQKQDSNSFVQFKYIYKKQTK